MEIGMGILIFFVCLLLFWLVRNIYLENQRLVQTRETAQSLISENEILKEKNRNLASSQDQLDLVMERLSEQTMLLEKEKHTADLENNSLRHRINSLEEKLSSQELELEKMGKRFQNEFELLANRILEEKSRKFSLQNQENIEKILHPLGKELEAFKKQVQETYDRESKERFSLERKVKELAELNLQISQEAKNLTQALKGNAKIRGNWGEAILETILQNSGLEKNRHYSIQEFLRDEAGNPLLGMDGKKMQPDVIIHYPDQRKVIIDSKVSLLAYERYSSATDETEQQTFLASHLKAVRTHIDQLSSKNYESYSKVLDFVIMFIPLEAAYIAILQADSKIWEYAYKKRVLMISSSNLIAALKMIKDLWIRDDQNKYALQIADRGGKMYDKFVAFLGNLEDVGKHLEKSQESYDTALKQLKTGKGNLVSQAEKLRELGVSSKSHIPEKIDSSSR
jgi:DNA recombination protein RmuC